MTAEGIMPKQEIGTRQSLVSSKYGEVMQGRKASSVVKLSWRGLRFMVHVGDL